MPRLTFEEPLVDPTKGTSTKHRQEVKKDGVVVVLKAATFAVVIALVGAVVLLLTAGGDEPRAKTPDVPEIRTSHAQATTSTTPPAGIVAPEVRSDTTVMSMPPTTTERPRPTGRPPGRGQRFAIVGKSCDTPGSYAFTKRYEPVVCAEPGPTWRLLFQ